ncbi:MULTISPECIES: hypothetical protein [Mycolicibacterium]|uniref:Uncharacterized protein n=1 Tax=Mycolicibacterium conceptionense TaxID=451644 RepID=A0A0U1DYE5_9MYCO|nr:MULTISPECIES: hypothetical protein [Mycolicibacterium]ORV21729.1 hypothetical protein AWB98_27135 [Mycolicibacterium conceptionense]GJJ21995.1 hypothetical protein MTY414_56680 [Mycolicibacterium mageritense]CQD25072.1 hypothetical protein BN970_06870 [Mycolicibacterium conceptionense]
MSPTERQLAITTHQMALDEALDTALTALYRAARSITVLTHKTINDSAYVEGPQGADVASFINDSLRNVRAAYAIAHPIRENNI